MRSPALAIVIQLTILILVDFFVFGGLSVLVTNDSYKLAFLSGYILLTIGSYAGIAYIIRHWRIPALYKMRMHRYIQLGTISVFVVKLSFLFLLVIADAGRWLAALIIYLSTYLGWTSFPSDFLHHRPEQLVAILLILVLLFLSLLLFGIFFGKYRFTIERCELFFPDLPAAFDGFRLVQISDAHSGSWDSLSGVQKGIDLINRESPDMIVFTGDLVNQYKDEIDPFKTLFASLSAPFGKYAILGNHDYYGQPAKRQDRPAYWADFYEKYKSMHFDLLNNENRRIVKNGSAIKLVGVENWGSGRWFPKRGDLDKALEGVSSDDFIVLLSHDPSHWDAVVLPHSRHIPLTLSGHTHAMQFGINLPFFKWSPIRYRYKKWMGLYKEKGQMLYVNRGFGFLGFPGRVGMWPEITVITLRQEKIADS